MPDTWRMFIALELPPDVLRAIKKAHTEVDERFPRHAMRMARLEGIHLTLKFLGDGVPAHQVEALAAALAAAASGHSPFELAVDGMGCFPNTRHPRVIWLGVEGHISRLKGLRASVERQVSPLGYPTEKRSFNPHLTLGRVDRKAPRPEVAAIGDYVERSDIGTIARWQAEKISLIRSELQRGGAIYTTMAEVILANG